MKLASQESNLEDIKNYTTIYGGKANSFKNPIQNLRWAQARPLKSTIILSGKKIHCSYDAPCRVRNIEIWKEIIIFRIYKVPRGRY